MESCCWAMVLARTVSAEQAVTGAAKLATIGRKIDRKAAINQLSAEA